MATLDDYIAFCKAQAAYHSKKATTPNLPPHQVKKHGTVGARIAEIGAFLERLPRHLPTEQGESDRLFDLDPFRLEGVPEELVEELKIGAGERADAQIIELFRIAGRPLNISEVLIGMFRKFNDTQKRTAVSARLYRLSQEGYLESVEKNRGVYQLAQSKEEKPAP